MFQSAAPKKRENAQEEFEKGPSAFDKPAVLLTQYGESWEIHSAPRGEILVETILAAFI